MESSHESNTAPLIVERQPYDAPALQRLGDLRQLTLGGSLGTGDSGAPRVQRRR